MTTETPQRDALHCIIITGLSGAGRSVALNALEDLGLLCVDNLPLQLLPRFVDLYHESGVDLKQIAVGVDVRIGVLLDEVTKSLQDLSRRGITYQVLFLEASDDVLTRRFSETRRRHPLGLSARGGIREERRRTKTLRAIADRIIDTTAFTVHQLRDELRGILSDATGGEAAMRVLLVSFGYKYGVPTDTDIVLDVRFLPNPFFVEELRALDGTDPAVARYVLDRDETQEFLALTTALLDFSLPLYVREGKRYLTVGLGCTGGRHRSVAIAHELERRLFGHGYPVRVQHRDVSR